MTLAVTNLLRVLYADPAGDPFTQRRYTVNSSTINPDSIIRQFSPLIGEVVLYNPHDCVRVVDDAATTFTLDEDGVPTIVGVDGTLGIKYGVYNCTITFRGVDFTVQVAHYDDATMLATWDFPAQDAAGFSIVNPEATQVIYYVDPTGGDDGTATTYTGASPPTGGWEQPTSVLAYDDINTVIALKGAGDWVLLKRGEVFYPTTKYGIAPGTDPLKPTGLLAYGDPALDRPSIRTSANTGTQALGTTGLKNIIFMGVEVYADDRNPDSPNWCGDWAINKRTMLGWSIYGGGSSYVAENTLVEDVAIRYCSTGMVIGGAATFDNTIFRRNVLDTCYGGESGSTEGFGLFGSAQEAPIYFGENVMSHCGWYFPQANREGTSDSGSATTIVHAGQDFPQGDKWKGVAVIDPNTANTGVITDITGDVITFTGLADFTTNRDYEIDYPTWAQANIYSHNWYCSGLSRTLYENNWSIDSSSAASKWTSSDVNPSDELTQRWNVSMGNKIGFGWGGNNPTGAERFYDSKVMENIDIEGGAADSTSQKIAYGIGASDWLRGIAALNIVKDTDPRVISSFYGLRIAYNQTNSIFAYNKFINLGLPSGSSVTSGSGGIHTPTSGDLGPTIPTNVNIIGNDAQMIDTDALTWGDYRAAFTSELNLSGNRYYGKRPLDETCDIDNVLSSHTELITESGETGATIDTPIEYVGTGYGIAQLEYDRGVVTYDRDTFLASLLARRKGAWDSTLDAKEFYAESRAALVDKTAEIGMAVTYFTLGDGTGLIITPETYQQNIDFPAGTGTLKAMIFLMVNDKASDSPTTGDNLGWGAGFTDGLQQYFVWAMTDHENTGTQKSYSLMSNEACGGRIQDGAIWDKSCTFVNFDTPDRAVIETISSKPATFFTFPIAIAGDNVNVTVGSHTVLAGTGQQKIVTGNATDLFMLSTTWAEEFKAINGAQDLYCMNSLGVAAKSENVEQMSFTQYSPNGVTANTVGCHAIYNDTIAGKLLTPANKVASIAVTDMVLDGVIIQSDADVAGALLPWISISWTNKPRIKIVDVTIPTTGDITFDNPGFKPRFGILMAMAATGVQFNTPLDADTQMILSVFDEDSIRCGSSQYASNVPVNNGTATGHYFDYLAAPAINDPAGSDDFVTSSYTLTGSGVDFTVTDNLTTAAIGRLLVIG